MDIWSYDNRMEMIKLHIKCMTGDDSSMLRDLGVKVQENTEYRPLRIRKDKIIAFYPDMETGCFLMVGRMELSVSESFEELEKLIL